MLQNQQGTEGINARTFIDWAQRGHKEPKEFLAMLPGLSASNVLGFSRLVYGNYEQGAFLTSSPSINRAKLSEISEQFHARAGTLTADVRNALRLFKSGAPVLRIAHTPDHLGYTAVYAETILLDTIARSFFVNSKMSPCEIFIVVDWDLVEDQRLRISYFPDVEREFGALRLSTHVSEDSFHKLQYAVPKPSKEEIREWFSSLENLFNRDLKILYRGGIPQLHSGLIRERLAEIESEIWEAHERSKSLSDFNAIFLSRIINNCWNLPILFLPSMEISTHLLESYQFLFSQYPTMVDLSIKVAGHLKSSHVSIREKIVLSLDEFPFWYVCPECDGRVNLKIESYSALEVAGICSHCKTPYRAKVGTFENPDFSALRGKIIPKVLLDDLNDIAALRILGGASYIGSAEHVLMANLIASALGWPVPPECLLRPRGIYYGTAELRVALQLGEQGLGTLPRFSAEALQRIFFGRASILYSLVSQGIEGTLEMWRNHFRTGKQFYEISVGESSFLIPDRLRLLLEKEMRDIDENPIQVSNGIIPHKKVKQYDSKSKALIHLQG